jgi:glycogen debranching enzyme
MIMEKLTGKSSYGELAIKVKEAFNEKFWNNTEQCLYDVLSGGEDEGQIRCNQIWALTMPFTMLEPKREELIVSKVRKELYTTIGLRTLSMKDKDFHGIYIGEMEERDRAYHQGTVWAFPLGAYYLACIKLGLKGEVDCGIKKLEYWLHEGCAAQIAEIYDGKEPTISRGCYAQAWSVCELLRAVREYEKI